MHLHTHVHAHKARDMERELKCVSDVTFLPHHVCLLIARIKPPHNFVRNDCVILGSSNQGNCTTKSMHAIFSRQVWGASNSGR